MAGGNNSLPADEIPTSQETPVVTYAVNSRSRGSGAIPPAPGFDPGAFSSAFSSAFNRFETS